MNMIGLRLAVGELCFAAGLLLTSFFLLLSDTYFFRVVWGLLLITEIIIIIMTNYRLGCTVSALKTGGNDNE